MAAVSAHADVSAIAMEDAQRHVYPATVRASIRQDARADYLAAARLINAEADVVSLQHEFGIFGGDDGEYVLDFMDAVRVPVVPTFHTVLRKPTASQAAILPQVARKSARVIVMNARASTFLREVYGIPDAHASVIPHGIPDMPFVDPDQHKHRLGLEGQRVVLSFGLLSPSKGFEHVIRALSAITREHPNTVYVIAGATHPAEQRQRGESYRDTLESLARDLGVRDHLRFIDRFLPQPELSRLLLAADIYITPYPAEEQISSGTLSYALGSGTAVVSTPYWHAQELLRHGRGVLVPFSDPDSIALQVSHLLSNDRERERLRRRAYEHARSTTWDAVARRHLLAFAAAARWPQSQGRERVPVAR